MPPGVDRLIAASSRRALVVDTNLLLLYLVGLTGRANIQRFKRTSMYEPRDLELLVDLMRRFRARFITPNIMTEVGNLSDHAPAEFRRGVLGTISSFVRSVEESYVPTTQACESEAILRVGLADATTVELAERGAVILTDDLPLYVLLQERQLPSVNFNHVRSWSWEQ